MAMAMCAAPPLTKHAARSRIQPKCLDVTIGIFSIHEHHHELKRQLLIWPISCM